MNLRKKFDFLDQGYIEEYAEELYSKEGFRILLNCKSSKIWIEINEKIIEDLKVNEGERIIKVEEFIEVLTKDDSAEISKFDLDSRLGMLDRLYDGLIL